MTNDHPTPESLSGYQLFISLISFLAGIMTAALSVTLILEDLTISVGVAIFLVGVVILVKKESKDWAWKEATSFYNTYLPFIIGFGFALVFFGLVIDLP